jgi:hypothetical protein
MAKTKDAREENAAAAVRELLSLTPGTTLGTGEWLDLVARLPRMDLADEWSSADVIRELRGPLPEDDPDYQHHTSRH